jgi:hypothetical protein
LIGERFCASGDYFGIVFGEADPPLLVERVVLNAFQNPFFLP